MKEGLDAVDGLAQQGADRLEAAAPARLLLSDGKDPPLGFVEQFGRLAAIGAVGTVSDRRAGTYSDVISISVTAR